MIYDYLLHEQDRTEQVDKNTNFEQKTSWRRSLLENNIDPGLDKALVTAYLRSRITDQLGEQWRGPDDAYESTTIPFFHNPLNCGLESHLDEIRFTQSISSNFYFLVDFLGEIESCDPSPV